MGPVAEHRPVLPSLTLGDFAMALGIEGLHVLVTAGANGMGLEIASTLVREGARVHVTVFFCQAEDGIRDESVTGVQTCALPICDQIDAAGQVQDGTKRDIKGA